MQFISEHSDLIFLFFTIPFVGWVLYKVFNVKAIRVVLAITLILLLPIFTGYSYVIDSTYLILIYIALSCGQYFLISYHPNLFRTVIMPSISLFLILGCISFVGAFYGSVSINNEWDVKNYKIKYVRDQGFSGGPLMRYELYQYAIIPIFIKHVETRIDSDTTNSCIIKFKYQDFSFNKCSNRSY